MNIFFSSLDPVACARFLDNKRAVKMPLETAQMLSTAVRSTGLEVGYKATHANHPSNVWARASKQNFLWLCEHGLALCAEYTRRYGKVHKSEAIIKDMIQHADRFESVGLTTLPNCAANKEQGLDFKSEPCIHTAYRKYLSARFLNDKKPAVCNLYATR